MKNIWSVCHSFCRWNTFENEDTGHMLLCKGLVFKSCCAFSSSVVQVDLETLFLYIEEVSDNYTVFHNVQIDWLIGIRDGSAYFQRRRCTGFS